MAATIQLKRGDTLDQLLLIPEETFPNGYFVGWTLKSQVRKATAGGTLIAELTPTWADPAADTRFLRLASGSTNDWPVGTHEIDVQFTDSNGLIESTETLLIDVLKDITQ